MPSDRSSLPEALVFDLDGTIVDTETVEYEAIRAVWADHGLDYAPSRYADVIGQVASSRWLEDLEREVERRLDRSILIARHRAVHRELTAALQPRDGIVAIIESALDAEVPIAVASNSPRWWVDDRLEALGLAAHVAAIRGFGDSAPKPDPAPFLAACADLGADPRRSVAFEDSVTGVRSAVAAGLLTVACAGPLSAGHDLSAADLVITTHTDVTLEQLGLAVAARHAG